ncbi:hypothetical protein JXJ21_03150 [candidate division KSB1 bacterium]|nr:hypothetical protein [candidate division KSB1 bacterium]
MKKAFCRFSFLFTAAVLVFVLAFWVGCNKNPKAPEATQLAEQAPVLSKSNPRIQEVMAVQDWHTPELMADPNVVGTATGLTSDGQPAILIFTKTDVSAALKKSKPIPTEIEGIPVVVEVTGEIRPLKGKPQPPPGVDHQAIQTPPIQLGTSGGWRFDLANGYCCAGTLGSLIQVGGQKRILSNYHVFEADIVPGGNGIVAQTGDPIVQPGLIDVGCQAANAQDVATLVTTSSLPYHNVDASTATIIDGMVDPTGAILEIGTLSSSTVEAAIGQSVKKSGRTTGLTRSTISGLNGTVSVAYEDECAGSPAFTVIFTGQIIIANRGSKFLAAGDSGSLLVEDVDTNPRAVGLLFAGGSQTAVANPIDEVLDFLGATMVGN